MSNRPAIGFWFLPTLVDHCRHLGVGTTELDVPTHIKISGQNLPIGRTLRNHLRYFLGVDKQTQLVASEVRNQVERATHTNEEIHKSLSDRRERDKHNAEFFTNASNSRKTI